jgi:hypothetical protein
MADARVPAELRRMVLRRANGCCEYCRSQARFATQPFSVDHVTPRSREGDSSWENLCLACQGCNNHKYYRTEGPDPLTGNVVPLFHPRKDHWNDHFIWSNDATLILGLSPTGRATVALLQLNRPGLLNLRRVLFAAGEHPPHESTEGVSE